MFSIKATRPTMMRCHALPARAGFLAGKPGRQDRPALRPATQSFRSKSTPVLGCCLTSKVSPEVSGEPYLAGTRFLAAAALCRRRVAGTPPP